MAPASEPTQPVPRASTLQHDGDPARTRPGQISLLGKQTPILVAAAVLVLPMVGALLGAGDAASFEAVTQTLAGFGPMVAVVSTNLQGLFGGFTAQFGFIALSMAALVIDRAFN